MDLIATNVDGVVIVDLQRHSDERGWFARAYCSREFEAAGLNPTVVQANIASNRLAGTLRGLHHQVLPASEAKLVRCIRGSVFDVAVDLRPGSPTFLSYFGLVLDSASYRGLYVPEGCAHGYLTLTDDTDVVYLVSEFYTPGAEAGIRWDDPALAIEWPAQVRVISEKDASWPYLPRTGS